MIPLEQIKIASPCHADCGASAAPTSYNKPLTPPLMAESHFPPAQSHKPELVVDPPVVLKSDDMKLDI